MSALFWEMTRGTASILRDGGFAYAVPLYLLHANILPVLRMVKCRRQVVTGAFEVVRMDSAYLNTCMEFVDVIKHFGSVGGHGLVLAAKMEVDTSIVVAMARPRIDADIAASGVDRQPGGQSPVGVP